MGIDQIIKIDWRCGRCGSDGAIEVAVGPIQRGVIIGGQEILEIYPVGHIAACDFECGIVDGEIAVPAVGAVGREHVLEIHGIRRHRGCRQCDVHDRPVHAYLHVVGRAGVSHPVEVIGIAHAGGGQVYERIIEIGR